MHLCEEGCIALGEATCHSVESLGLDNGSERKSWTAHRASYQLPSELDEYVGPRENREKAVIRRWVCNDLLLESVRIQITLSANGTISNGNRSSYNNNINGVGKIQG
mgnify:CR=1 FL=1